VANCKWQKTFFFVVKYDNAMFPAERLTAREIPSEQKLAAQHNQNPQMFMKE
jgi:hypothetical protein